VVDPQVQFCNDHTRHVYPRIQALLGSYDYVVVSQLVPDADGPIERMKRYRPAARGTPGFGLCIDLSMRPAERTLRVEKALFSAFTPEVRAWARERGLTEFHICGGDTDLCVMRTANDIFEAGLRPVVLGTLCASYAGEPLHSHALIQLKRMLGKPQVVFGDSPVAVR
jgi:nicotinamidase-related amidase